MSGPSPLAHAVRERLRVEHAACDRAGCHLAALWAEDVQRVLDLARELADPSDIRG